MKLKTGEPGDKPWNKRGDLTKYRILTFFSIFKIVNFKEILGRKWGSQGLINPPLYAVINYVYYIGIWHIRDRGKGGGRGELSFSCILFSSIFQY